MVTSDLGYRLRAVVTRPKTAKGRLPGLLLVGWLSCDPVEALADTTDGFVRLLHGIARESGFVFLRVDKPGVGGSGGPPCSENDLEADLAAYRAGLRALAARADVDMQRLYVLGMSNGGGIAPLVANGTLVAGYVVSGGWVKTWLERMLELERRRLTLSGKDAGEVSAAMQGFADFYSLYLNGRLTPAEVLGRRPDLKPLWYDQPAHQYGRPAAFYHQLQALNLAAAWEKVDVPTLVVHGEHDWLMSRDDHEMIAALVNRKRPGAARFVTVPKMDHFYLLHGTPEEAFRDEPPGRHAQDVETLIAGWLRDQAARSQGGR